MMGKYAYDEECNKYTVQKRENETGLDYFGARYMSAPLGRFMSPDPLMASALTSNPQTWNRYSYGLNNPLRFIDPTGMYICDGTDKECEEFEKTLSDIRSSSDEETIRAANAYGARGENNGIRVRFLNALANNRRGGEVSKIGIGLEQDPDNPDSFRASLTVSIAKSQIGNADIVAHEGSHVADKQDFVKSLSSDLTNWNESLNISNRQSEIRAWQLSIGLMSTGNLKSNYGTCGVDECKFTPGMLPGTRDRLINQLLDDPRNRYLGLDLKIYPEFLKPQQ